MKVSGQTLTVVGVVGILGVMTTLTAYSVPLYELFCRVTGYGGTTQVATGPADRVLERRITIRFNADINSALPWRFEPVQDSIRLRVGEKAMAYYQAKSLSDQTLTGTATFNVVPAKAGIYFNKIACFCFTEQTLAAGETVKMPVQFFVDPAIADDRGLDDVTTITLSYTFFKSMKSKDSPSAKTASIEPSLTAAHNGPTVN
jgi:cytochrome c oxidase assembly protein subunit 11